MWLIQRKRGKILSILILHYLTTTLTNDMANVRHYTVQSTWNIVIYIAHTENGQECSHINRYDLSRFQGNIFT